MNVQMNVRIDDTVKRAGDMAFANAGLTPTQVVRSVWEFAAAHQDNPALVRKLFDEALNGSTDELKRFDLHQIDEASSTCARLRERFGLTAPDALEEIDYDALRMQATYERLAERGLA